LVTEAAFFVAPHEPERAEELYRSAMDANPELGWIKDRFQKFIQSKKTRLSNIKAWKKIEEKQYFTHEIECDGGPR
jgi:hypothetical protein